MKSKELELLKLIVCLIRLLKWHAVITTTLLTVTEERERDNMEIEGIVQKTETTEIDRKFNNIAQMACSYYNYFVNSHTGT